MSHRAWPELLLVLSSVLVAGAVAAQQAPSEAPAGAQAPSSPTPASTAEQPAKTEASSAAMSSSTSAAQPAAAATGPSPELIKDAKSNGYKIKVVRGQTRFCKSETPIGTHFPTETCLNEDQLRLSMQQAQQARDSMTQSMGATK